ncbi:uncharacterized protein LOC117332652 [Pecten maximus]|uniref:uncharacterized protein LOC117332652 n=1 Tax=Pecten maximus TaxID=6579 RepID=UPI001458E78C|nr:uncharacterized protein LOC117332652 [Pecten maximus]XP_033747544.1 uncharacterized protein LOC117332652 [Pecten maximus]
MGGSAVQSDSSETQDNVGFLDSLQQINEYFGLQEKMAVIQQSASDHPIAALFLMVTIVMCSLPLFCFFTFVFVFTIFGFTGFVVFEGVVLTLSSILLVGALFVMGLLSFGLFTFSFSWNMVNQVSTKFPLPECVTARLPDRTNKDKEM